MKDSFVQQKKTKLSSTEKKTEKKKKNVRVVSSGDFLI